MVEAREREDTASRFRAGKAFRWLKHHIVAAAVTALAGLGASAGVRFLFAQITGGQAQPLGVQIDAIKKVAAEEGLYAVIDRPVELHGRKRTSQLLVLRPRKGTEASLLGGSDEVRLYDYVDGRLRLAFRFQPKRDPTPYRFHLAAVGHLDNTDRQEVLGQYMRQYVEGTFPYPVVIMWDETVGAYRLRALLPQPSGLLHAADAGVWGRLARKRYARHWLRDTKSSTSISAFGADFVAVQTRPFPILAAAFTLRAECYACPHLSEVRAWRVDFQRPVAVYQPCHLFPWQDHVLVRRDQHLNPARVWLSHSSQAYGFC